MKPRRRAVALSRPAASQHGPRAGPATRGPFARVAIEGDTGRGVVRREHAVALAAGHFPGDPFLPGAYLVELMAALAERVAAPARMRAIVRCAFARRVRPDTEIVVTARATGTLVEAHLEAGGEPAAHATLRLA